MMDTTTAGRGTRWEALSLMWWLVLPVLALLVMLTIQQYQQGLKELERGLLRKAEEHAQELEAIARPAEAHVHDLRRLLETTWHAPPRSRIRLKQLMRPLETGGDEGNGVWTGPDGWTLDLVPDAARPRTGQIWWAPANRAPPDPVWLDRAALFLQTARVAHERAPGFQGSYFVAAEANISWAFPWADTPSMLAAMGAPNLQGLESQRLEGVERGREYVKRNPTDLTYWGPPYVGQLDGALVQSHGSLVVVDGEYAGEVSVDFRIDTLQALAVRWQEQSGARVWLIDRRGNIVADSQETLSTDHHSRADANQRVEIKLSSRLSKAAAQASSKLLQATPGEHLVSVENDLLLAASREQSPWVYVLSIPQTELRARVLPSLVPNALVGLALVLVFVLGQWLFARRFVAPALSVLRYLQSLSVDPKTPEPSLGRRWEGWIKAISRVFARQRLAQQQLEAQRETLRQNERLSVMGSLLAGVAHELNNPLAVLMGRVNLLEERMEAAEQSKRIPVWSPIREDFQGVRRAAERCSAIVRTFLNMARQQPVSRHSMHLNDVVRSSLELLSHSLNSRGIDIQLDLADDLPEVSADADQLGQLVLNLVVNAQQALDSNSGQRRIYLSTGFTSESSDPHDPSRSGQVWLRIADNGPGVPEGLRDRLFEPFFTSKAAGQGTGLGLSISRGVAREHGGELSLEPHAERGGASFRLSLPVKMKQLSTSRDELSSVATELLAARRILLIEDEPEMMEMIRSSLENAGYEVASAESVEVALELLREARFDAIVSELLMPGIDGRNLWHQVRALSPALAQRLLFVTGDPHSPLARNILTETSCTALNKPVDSEELLQTIESLVRQVR
jgi:signal transduction histidine kinase/CheY-like chemotaxis protein